MSVFKTISEIEEKKKTEPMEGFFWPLDHWFIERALFAINGGITITFIFLFFVFFKLIFLFPPMLLGGMQIIFSMTGFSITVKILQSLGMKQNSIQ